MEVTGTVTKVIHRRSNAGSRYLSVTLRRDDGSETRLTYLQTFQPEPEKWQRVSISGMPLMYAPRRGQVTTNIGAVTVKILEGKRSAT